MNDWSLFFVHLWMVMAFYLLFKNHFFLAFKRDKGWMQNDSCALQLKHLQYKDLFRKKKDVEGLFDWII